MAETYPGYKGCLMLGANTVASVTKWGQSGAANKMLDKTALLDAFDKYDYGTGNGGKVAIAGWLDTTDTNGQNALKTAWINKATLATGTTNDPRLYYSAAGYLELSTGAACLVEDFNSEADVSGEVAFTCTLVVSGGYFKVHT